MSRIIMLIPLDEDVGLSSISISIIYFFNKKIFKNNSQKSILYFSCSNNLQNDTSFIISKYFSKFVHILNGKDFSKKFFYSSDYFSLLNTTIEDIYYKKSLYELVLIEGLNNNVNIYSQEMNYDISQNLSAEVIFLVNLKNNSLESLKEKEKKIELIIKKKKFKNVLGVIFNKINSPFIEKKINFIKKLKILKNIKENQKELENKKEIFTNTLVPTIACIPWNKNIKKTYIIHIYNFLDIPFLNSLKTKNSIVEEVVIFDESCNNMTKKDYFNTLIIVSYSRIDTFIDMFSLTFNSNKIVGIILTGVSISEKNIILLCNILIKKNIHIAFTKKNTIDVLSQLQNFNFNISLKDKTHIKKLQKYISYFFIYSSIIIPKKQNNYHMTYSPKEFFCYLKYLSRKYKKRIILPESYEIRILKAASICQKNNIAQCVLLGDKRKIHNIANENGINLDKNIEIINPILIRDKYISRFLELRKNKGLNKNFAKKILEENIVLATLILEGNEVDGLVSGSVNTTANTILPALQLIKTNAHTSLVSSIFFMLLPNKVLIYADCAVNINPTAEELAEIAIQSSYSLKIFGVEPRIAMLSYSTGYSGHGCEVEKVRKATSIIKNRHPDLIVDGPIQYDASVSKTVFQLKSPNSPIKGSANIFVFPDLNSGNIAYKAVQRTANIVSIGPILQGLKKPVNDLSRGASVEDIIYTIALTAIQSV
ncbi:MAG: phosphate acetyltransferase [Buchnera aphidicola (Brevicoryne brassicae)]|uniref:Phosphate acetyltransferase n=1 Tax=Buchnera aphidicola (Brevicoryne brassicae) TaxID=911343 RepID=A0AAJ5PVY2_9GAMM|nr:phosphate acetyltransferase [Buchnera aphidicola]QCI19754.1 phosphate acetyltransferase [Buchnera aphidicola (Brevicoryne brassicae)]WAI19123.1 MAG: phosphate acetyltransferase [Buchnera aphidicola (Brevicoryne brassicae)]